MSRSVTDAKPSAPNPNLIVPIPRQTHSDLAKGPRSNVYVEQGDKKKFVERNFENGSLSYPRDGSEPGKLIIFNYEFAEIEDKTRFGSRRDVMEIITNFQRLGFNISEEDIHTDLKKAEVIDELTKVASSNLKQVNCLIVFFLTHGDDNNSLETTDFNISVEEIYQKFAKCDDLKDKPKMFIFQACKGAGTTTTLGSDTPDPRFDKIVPMNTLKNNFPPDMILIFSTIEGNVSYRTGQGSWFIQELCRNFHAYGRRDDVTSLVIRTTKCVCGNYYHHDAYENSYKKQMPLMISTLKRKFYLNTNKERHLLVKIVKDIELIKIRMSNIEKSNK